jgi:hypothetical protein
MAAIVHPPEDAPIKDADVQPADNSAEDDRRCSSCQPARVHAMMPSPIPCMSGAKDNDVWGLLACIPEPSSPLERVVGVHPNQW